MDFSWLPTKRTCGCPNEKLGCLPREELKRYSSTIINIPKRIIWENKYKARFIPQVPEKFIRLFSHPGETILDPFTGSGTTNVVAKHLNRNSIGIDINPSAVILAKSLLNFKESNTKHEIIEGNCIEIMKSIPEASIDLIITSPPYLDVVDYQQNHPEQWGNIRNYRLFLSKMESAFKEIKRILKPKRHLVVITQDIFKSKAKCPLHADYIFICRDKLGFEVISTQVYILNYSAGGRPIFGYPKSYHPKNDHEFIVIFRKEKK
jgi:DNA modification methylase